MANQVQGPGAETSAAPAGPVSLGGPSRGRRSLCRGAGTLLRGGFTCRGSRANRNFANPIARTGVPFAIRNHAALAIRRQAERDATAGKRVVKCVACNIPITLLAGTRLENSTQWPEHAKGKAHKRNTKVFRSFSDCCTVCPKRKNGNYSSFNSHSP